VTCDDVASCLGSSSTTPGVAPEVGIGEIVPCAAT